jgi:DsbC/DsbD-like thiol-disulfide interchange protein
MPRVLRLAPLALALAVCFVVCSLSVAQGGKKSDSVVKAKARVENQQGNKATIVVHLDIQKGWHLYANPVGHEDLTPSQTVVTVGGVKADSISIKYPAGIAKQDKILGKYNVYEDQVEIRATVERQAANMPVEVGVRLSACDDKHCLPPSKIQMTLP